MYKLLENSNRPCLDRRAPVQRGDPPIALVPKLARKEQVLPIRGPDCFSGSGEPGLDLTGRAALRWDHIHPRVIKRPDRVGDERAIRRKAWPASLPGESSRFTTQGGHDVDAATIAVG